MRIAIITGSGGLIGSESVNYFAPRFDRIIGIDNDMRSYFFGEEASTTWMAEKLKRTHKNYMHETIDIRNFEALSKIFKTHGKDIALIIHTAAQPSHDWAAKEPFTDFSINANGTLNMLEAMRKHASHAVFIFTSTNKVYGDLPNSLPLVEKESRWEIDDSHPYFNGIDETMSIDKSKHSLFGASKVAADVMAQEYGRYFGLSVGIFRGGCLTGPTHSGAELHGFLAYLMKCAVMGREYTIFGYKGKQVRDNIHSSDLIRCFDEFYKKPRSGEVYNMGGSRFSQCSMKEAIKYCEELTGYPMKTVYKDTARIGDHIWYISDIRKFQRHYPEWKLTKNIGDILKDIYDAKCDQWMHEKEMKAA